MRAITCAMVNVLPEPVTPSSTWSRSCWPTPATSSVIAAGWSPLGSNSLTSSKRMPPSDLSGRCGRCGVQASPTRMLGSPASSSACRLWAVALAPLMPKGCAACFSARGGAGSSGSAAGLNRAASLASMRDGVSASNAACASSKPGRVTLSAGLSSAARCSSSGTTSGLAARDLPVGRGPAGLPPGSFDAVGRSAATVFSLATLGLATFALGCALGWGSAAFFGMGSI